MYLLSTLSHFFITLNNLANVSFKAYRWPVSLSSIIDVFNSSNCDHNFHSLVLYLYTENVHNSPHSNVHWLPVLMTHSLPVLNSLPPPAMIEQLSPQSNLHLLVVQNVQAPPVLKVHSLPVWKVQPLPALNLHLLNYWKWWINEKAWKENTLERWWFKLYTMWTSLFNILPHCFSRWIC